MSVLGVCVEWPVTRGCGEMIVCKSRALSSSVCLCSEVNVMWPPACIFVCVCVIAMFLYYICAPDRMKDVIEFKGHTTHTHRQTPSGHQESCC